LLAVNLKAKNNPRVVVHNPHNWKANEVGTGLCPSIFDYSGIKKNFPIINYFFHCKKDKSCVRKKTNANICVDKIEQKIM